MRSGVHHRWEELSTDQTEASWAHVGCPLLAALLCLACGVALFLPWRRLSLHAKRGFHGPGPADGTALVHTSVLASWEPSGEHVLITVTGVQASFSRRRWEMHGGEPGERLGVAGAVPQ